MKERKRLQDRLVEKQGTAVFASNQHRNHMRQLSFIICRGYPIQAHHSTAMQASRPGRVHRRIGGIMRPAAGAGSIADEEEEWVGRGLSEVA